MKRRDFLRTAGVAGAGLASVGAAGTAGATHQGYFYHGTAPAPGVEELVTEDGWAFCATNGAITTVDLSDPTMPVTAARTQGPDPTSTHDVKVDTFETADDEERRIALLCHTRVENRFSTFDVTDPNNPEYLTSIEVASTVHNGFLKDGYAYLSITDSTAKSRMVIYDVHDPADPETMEGRDESYESYQDVPDDERGTGGSWMLEDARPNIAQSGGSVLHDLYVTDEEGGELAYLVYWDGGTVIVDVTEKRHPVAVAHFGAAEYALEGSVSNQQYVNGGGDTNAHYVQPTPGGDYTLVGAETFGGTGHEEVGATGDHGGIRVFDTRDVSPLDAGGLAIYPGADDVEETEDPDEPDRIHPDAPFDGDEVVQTPPNRRHPDNFVDYVAYVEAPDQPDDVLLTSHNFDVTETKLFTSFYQGGVYAYDLAPLYRSGDYEEHPESAADVETPEEIAAFDPDGMAFWTAVNLSSAQEGEDRYFTIGSDIGKGAVSLELSDGPFTPL